MPVTKSNKSKLNKAIKRTKRRTEPLWKGPMEDGTTQSLIGMFLNCRERFRLSVVEGISQLSTEFPHATEYGSMFHLCEETFVAGGDWKKALSKYADQLKKDYKFHQKEVIKWEKVCSVQFPHYIEYKESLRDHDRKREHLWQERVFCVDYELPSGKVVKLRGKFDGVDLVGSGRKQVIQLVENKTKGNVDEGLITKQLQFDLQTMVYIVALRQEILGTPHSKKNIEGVLYNVIRRPLSGGRGTIKQKQNETESEYWERLEEYFINEPEYWFIEFESVVSPKEVDDFEIQFLVPTLEQMCSWWEWFEEHDAFFDPWSCGNPYHWRHPYGVYSPLSQGRETQLDEYLRTNNMTGLTKLDKLFTELEE